ncbi:hypothetical protein [Wohlfahrtiimonas chitiniclastica]|uniref:hypothetical protein n=1 Tax=Wohlfahrtiimonas chitiniclastica TaxID=400946 RepID=UPI001BD0B515|nr:hypothetical protein [Wohlfahrtiimonas chitiniclastica]MBS7837088.1 hypothetical protein [Wohlfahrtiimonas chitiniclastica]
MNSKIPTELLEKYRQSFSEKAEQLTSLLETLSHQAANEGEQRGESIKELHHFVYQLSSSATTYECKALADKTREFLKVVEQGDLNVQATLTCGQALVHLLQHP